MKYLVIGSSVFDSAPKQGVSIELDKARKTVSFNEFNLKVSDPPIKPGRKHTLAGPVSNEFITGVLQPPVIGGGGPNSARALRTLTKDDITYLTAMQPEPRLATLRNLSLDLGKVIEQEDICFRSLGTLENSVNITFNLPGSSDRVILRSPYTRKDHKPDVDLVRKLIAEHEFILLNSVKYDQLAHPELYKGKTVVANITPSFSGSVFPDLASVLHTMTLDVEEAYHYLDETKPPLAAFSEKVDSARKASSRLREKTDNFPYIVVTLGEDGAYLSGREGEFYIGMDKAPQLSLSHHIKNGISKPNLGAGDLFSSAVYHSIAKGLGMEKAVLRASIKTVKGIFGYNVKEKDYLVYKF